MKGPSDSVESMRVPNVDGLCSVTAVANGRECSVDLVVSSADDTPLLGWDLIHGLGLTIQGIPPSLPDSHVCASSSGEVRLAMYAIDFSRCPYPQLCVSNLPSPVTCSPVPCSEESPSCPSRLVSADAPSVQAATTYTYLPSPSCLHLLFHLCLPGRLCLVQLEMHAAACSRFRLTHPHSCLPLTTYPGCMSCLCRLCMAASLFQQPMADQTETRHSTYCPSCAFGWLSAYYTCLYCHVASAQFQS